MRIKKKWNLGILTLAGWSFLLCGLPQLASAATLCVNPAQQGCYATIGDAVSHAASGDTIEVAQGTYKEDVIIGKSLSLIGKNSANTIIDATGLGNGVYIDGLDHAGLSHVVVSGFTVENAKFEGVLITNASNVTVAGNHLTKNNVSLDASVPACPGIPDFETAEAFDCGEAIHLSGVDHSNISDNLIDNNSGGILVSDETGPTHDNVISGNTIKNNPFDCGITMPSHPRSPHVEPGPPFGVYKNLVTGNESSGNGTAIEGAGAGVGLFGFLPGARVSENVILGNRLTGNGLPGIAVHAHAPGANFSGNSFIGNYISGNGADTEDAFTPGPTGINAFGLTPVSGLTILLNVIKNEAVDIAVRTPAEIKANNNNLNGPAIGVLNLPVFGTVFGTVDATNNWWGCAHGPGAPGCSTVSGPNVTSVPFLSSPAVPNGQ